MQMLIHENELSVGVDFAAPLPLHSDYSSGTFEGFEVDLLQEISRHWGWELRYEVSLWSVTLQKLRDGKLDMISTAVTVTDERKRSFYFSKPYLSYRLCAVTHKKSPVTSADQLQAKKIGVRTATTAYEFVKDHLPDNTIILSETNDELYHKVQTGDIDLLVDDSPIAGGLLAGKDQLQVSLFFPDTWSDYAFAIQKGNEKLRDAIDGALQAMKEQGIYQTLFEKWFKNITL